MGGVAEEEKKYFALIEMYLCAWGDLLCESEFEKRLVAPVEWSVAREEEQMGVAIEQDTLMVMFWQVVSGLYFRIFNLTLRSHSYQLYIPSLAETLDPYLHSRWQNHSRHSISTPSHSCQKLALHLNTIHPRYYYHRALFQSKLIYYLVHYVNVFTFIIVIFTHFS